MILIFYSILFFCIFYIHWFYTSSISRNIKIFFLLWFYQRIYYTPFFYTKNIIYFYLTIPICVYVSFVRYFKEKNKLLIKTNKVLNLLKYEFTMYTVAVLTPYSISSFSFIRKIKSVEYAYIGCGISAALLLLTGVIHIKRTLLIRKELRNNNSK